VSQRLRSAMLREEQAKKCSFSMPKLLFFGFFALPHLRSRRFDTLWADSDLSLSAFLCVKEKENQSPGIDP